MHIRTALLALTVAACGVEPMLDDTLDAEAALEAAAIAEAETHEAEQAAQDVRFYDATVEAFLLDARAGLIEADATITYTVFEEDPEGALVPTEVEIGFGGDDSSGADDYEIMLTGGIEYTLNYCNPQGPDIRQGLRARHCNRNTARDTAEFWANRLAGDQCDALLDTSDGPSECAPNIYRGDTCVLASNSRSTREEQIGSDTACGTWPFRHARWQVSWLLEGECGFPCRTSVMGF